MSSHVLHLVRCLSRVFRRRHFLSDAMLEAHEDRRGDSEARNDPHMTRASAVKDEAPEGHEQNAVDNSKLGNHVAGYGDHLIRVSHGSVGLPDADGRLGIVSHSVLHANAGTFALRLGGVES